MRNLSRCAVLGLAMSVAIPSIASAQDFGIKGGLLWPDFRGDSGDPSVSYGRRTSFSAGVFLRFGLLQAEALYARRGAEVRDATAPAPTDTAVNEFRLDYLEVPVLVRLGGASGVFVGPYGAVRLSSKLVTGDGGTATEIDVSNAVEELDYGFVVGFGIDFGKFGIEGRYTQGLRRLFKDQPGSVAPDLKHRALGAFATLRF